VGFYPYNPIGQNDIMKIKFDGMLGSGISMSGILESGIPLHWTGNSGNVENIRGIHQSTI
jgi:hypothetical protein